MSRRSAELPVLGDFHELDAVAARHTATRVIVSPADLDQADVEELLRRCRALALKVSVLPQLSDVLGPAVELDDVEGVTVLGVNPPYSHVRRARSSEHWISLSLYRCCCCYRRCSR